MTTIIQKPHKDPFDAVKRAYSQGMFEEARIMEESILKKNPEQKYKIVSFHTLAELSRFITNDPYMLTVKEQVGRLANYDDPILIQGETGTGKELLAKALHGRRNNIKAKFVAVNCTSLPDELLESELFGHRKGAFTGATEDRIGKFQYAQGGTILLDEIGDMKPNLQAKLLRVLQEKRITPLGTNVESDELTFRLVCSTNKNLRQMVTNGEFRNDLLERITVFELRTTPLRSRIEDCALLAAHFSNKVEMRAETFPMEFDWKRYSIVSGGIKGNVREVQRIVRRFEVLDELPDVRSAEEKENEEFQAINNPKD